MSTTRRIEVREGSLFEPVAGETFDLIATNPPFVISPGDRRPAGLPRLRPAGRPGRGGPRPSRAATPQPGRLVPGAGELGDRARRPLGRAPRRLARRLVRRAGRAARGPRPRGVRRPLAQGLRSLRRSEHAERYDRWLGWFDDQGIEGVGFGWINLRRHPSAGPRSPAGAARLAVRRGAADRAGHRRLGHGGRPAAHRARPGEHCTWSRPRTWSRRPRARREPRIPSTIVLRRQRGFRRARQVDTVEAALVGACDGDLTVGQILDALAQLLDREPAELRTRLPAGGARAGRRGLPRAP